METKTLCPICRAPANHRFRPFCSARCADVDLGRWFSDAYAIPVGGEEEEQSRGAAEDTKFPGHDGSG